MPEDPPSILPRGTIILPSVNPSPHWPASAVYIQSVSRFCCNTGQAAGISSAGGGGPPASSSATRHPGSSESRLATTAPAEPPPTTTKSNDSAMGAASGCSFIDTPLPHRPCKRIYEAYPKVVLKKYRPTAARNELRYVCSGRR